MPYKRVSAQTATIGKTGWFRRFRSIESAPTASLSKMQRAGLLLQKDSVDGALPASILMYVYFLFFYFIQYLVQYKGFFTVVIGR